MTSAPAETRVGYAMFEIMFFPEKRMLSVTAKRTKPWLETLLFVKVRAPCLSPSALCSSSPLPLPSRAPSHICLQKLKLKVLFGPAV